MPPQPSTYLRLWGESHRHLGPPSLCCQACSKTRRPRWRFQNCDQWWSTRLYVLIYNSTSSITIFTHLTKGPHGPHRWCFSPSCVFCRSSGVSHSCSCYWRTPNELASWIKRSHLLVTVVLVIRGTVRVCYCKYCLLSLQNKKLGTFWPKKKKSLGHNIVMLKKTLFYVKKRLFDS